MRKISIGGRSHIQKTNRNRQFNIYKGPYKSLRGEFRVRFSDSDPEYPIIFLDPYPTSVKKIRPVPLKMADGSKWILDP
jgi:hypothetical protein